MKNLLFLLFFTPYSWAQELGCFVDYAEVEDCSYNTTILCNANSDVNYKDYGQIVGELCDEVLDYEERRIKCETLHKSLKEDHKKLTEKSEQLQLKLDDANSLANALDALTVRLRKRCGRACKRIK